MKKVSLSSLGLLFLGLLLIALGWIYSIKSITYILSIVVILSSAWPRRSISVDLISKLAQAAIIKNPGLEAPWSTFAPQLAVFAKSQRGTLLVLEGYLKVLSQDSNPKLLASLVDFINKIIEIENDQNPERHPINRFLGITLGVPVIITGLLLLSLFPLALSRSPGNFYAMAGFLGLSIVGFIFGEIGFRMILGKRHSKRTLLPPRRWWALGVTLVVALFLLVLSKT